MDEYETEIEKSVLTNIFYGDNVDMHDFFIRYTLNHFSDSNKSIYSAAKDLWASGKEVHPVSLKLLLPECSGSIDELYAANVINFIGYEKTLLINVKRKSRIKFHKNALYMLETGKMSYYAVEELMRKEVEADETSSADDARSVYDLMQEEIGIAELAPVGLSFIDDFLTEEDGSSGFEYGQLVTITGEQEAGKTQLLNQILFGMGSNKIDSLYFSLEFNKRSFQKYMRKKYINHGINIESAKHVRFLSDQDTTGNIYEVENKIRYYNKRFGVKVFAIDSQMMLDAEGIDGDKKNVSKTEEAVVTKIYRTLHHISNVLDILVIIIAQGSKEDNKSKRVEIFGSKKASHLAKIMLHMEKEFIEPECSKDGNASAGVYEVREKYFCRVAKNKQTGSHPRIALNFEKSSLEFWVKESDKVASWSGASAGFIQYKGHLDQTVYIANQGLDDFLIANKTPKVFESIVKNNGFSDDSFLEDSPDTFSQGGLSSMMDF